MAEEFEGSPEETDVVIVGSRCAGSAAGIALARSGVSVIALDGAPFPSDTMSTHLLWPSHFAEIQLLGALDRVLALDPPEHLLAGLVGGDIRAIGPFPSIDGIAYGSCVRRPGLDYALVQTAREAGVEVRERIRVTDLVWTDGRVVGVQWRGRDGSTGEIRCRLVIGADGRMSSVGRLVGATNHHEWENRRMMAFAYYTDPHEDERHKAVQWRTGRELATIFPCDGGQSLILLMSPTSRAAEYRTDPLGTFESTVASHPELAARLEGCTLVSKVRVSVKHPSFFRHSHGPGWALTGDAGHFKDPVTAQGIRDALRFGRLLGEAVGPVFDQGDEAVDAATLAWEDDRDAQCLPMYQWANGLGLDDEFSVLERAAYQWLVEREHGTTEILEVFSRVRPPSSLFNAPNLVRWVKRALKEADGSAARREVLRTLRRDVGREVRRRREEATFTRRRAASRQRFKARELPPATRSVTEAATSR